LDAPAKKNGTWSLDAEYDDHLVIVQWQKDAGFGVSCSPAHAYGEGLDEVYQNLEATYARIVCLLLSRTYTAPSAPFRISELRKERGISQEDLAALLDVRQAAVSKFERRNDVLVSSLREVIRAMGGELRIIAKFPDGTERTLEFEDDVPAQAKTEELATS
jgi:DNA-binding transcriptional regulator YiaG